MIDLLVKLLIKFVTSETMKEIAKVATKELVKRTKTGIDDELAKELIGDIAKSSWNRVKETAVKELLKWEDLI